MTRITETKSVKVDNWGVFFLQKLQNFFNKTDHCDLTLQFNDNSQLKVHRLVLSACTDYFNMLESTCEMYDDVLIMPLDLQADVIVPIVNFMYTGTLEFQYGIYEKLLKTAKDMNMTVLLKLLEAHKQTTRIGQGMGGRQPVLLNKQAPGAARGRNPPTSFHSAPQRSYGAVRGGAPAARAAAQSKVGPGVTVVKHQTTIAPVTPYRAQVPDTHALVSKYGAAKGGGGGKGPTRFDESSVPETLEGNFDDITYESTPLVTADQIKKEEESSPFEKLRKGYTNVGAKRPAPVSFSTPVAKKPNLQEVKEFTEAARLRSQLAADDDDSPGIADDTHFDDDEEEDGAGQQQQQQQLPVAKPLPTKASPGLKQIVIKQEPKTSPGGAGGGGGGGGVKQITVKDESGSVDHAKIISEVLKKYPHLVKKNKNIKLKIMQKTSPQAAASNSASAPAPVKMEVRTATPLKADISMVRKATEAIRQPAAPAPASTPTTSAGPKKIDSKTMHALIAKGAENMTGPWLCLRCGIDGRPISIPSYKAFRNHLIVKHKEKIDARICEHCGWRAEQRNPNLFYHWLTEHNIKSTIKFPTCAECGHVAMNASLLVKHEEENHQRGDLQQCIYCNKVFAKEMDLYDHMKALHKEKAREDGVIDFSDDEYQLEEDSTPSQSQNTSSENQKIKILSNISITNNAGLPFVIDTSSAQTVSQIGGKSQLQLQQITLEPSSEAEALSNVASGIATSLGLVSDAGGVVIEDGTFHHHHASSNQYIEHQMATVHGETGTTTTITAAGGPDQLTKLITEDGTELQLTQSQKEEIFSQLQNSGNGGNVVMVLNDDQFITGAGLQLEDGTELINAASGTADGQNSNIVVMYSQAGDELSTQSSTTVTTVAGGKKSEAAKAAAEDETSQASTLPSEKDGPVSEKGDDSQMEVDPESSQDRMDEDEEEEEAVRLAKEEEEKAAKEKEKLKLISELEGDWSEDTEEQPATEEPAAAEEKPKQVQKVVEKEKSPPSSSKTKEDAVAAEEAANEKEIDRLLDEWHSEVKASEAEPESEVADADAELEKKLEKVVGEEKTEEKSAKKEEEKEEEPPVKEDDSEEPAPAEQTPDVSVDDASLNDSESAQVVMVVAAESETETSTREDETSQQEEAATAAEVATEEEETSEKPAEEQKEEEKVKKDAEKEEPESKNNGEEDAAEAAKEDDEDEKEPEEDKTKSKEVVNSLLGDWDEDDDL